MPYLQQVQHLPPPCRPKNNQRTSLLRLRQICCHPALVDGTLANADSAKAPVRWRLWLGADRLARDVMGDDEDGEAVIEEAPLRPNPVTQDEMDAGSIELF